MALSDAQAYEGDGSTRDFSILGEIPSESHLRVWIDDVLQSSDSWDLLGNTVLFDDAPADGTSIQFIVSTTGTDFPTSPSDISKVAANISSVITVAEEASSGRLQGYVTQSFNNKELAATYAAIAAAKLSELQSGAVEIKFLTDGNVYDLGFVYDTFNTGFPTDLGVL